MVRVHVAGRDGLHVERLGELAQRGVPPNVAAFEGPLQLDEEAAAAEHASEARRTVRVDDAEPVPRAAGEADESGVVLLEERERERGVERRVLRPRSRPCVRRGQQPAEVGVAARILDEERHVRAARERHLGAGDRPDAERLRRVRELERAVDPVVVGDRERLVAELRSPQGQLLRQRRAVQERSTTSGRAARRSSRIGSSIVSVVPPGSGDKELLDDLFVSVLDATMDVEPHVHREHVDSFFVLKGTFTFNRSGEEVPLEPGDYGLAPPLLVHGFPAGRRPGPQHPHAGQVLGEDRGRRARRDAASRPRSTTRTTRRPTAGCPARTRSCRRAGEGEALDDERRRLRILAARPELCVFLFDTAPGYVGPGTHVHRKHIDGFFVLDGELEFELDGETVAAHAGTWVAATPGIAHTFRNAGDGRARFVNIHAPGLGFDEYLRRQAAGEDGRRFHESFDVYEVEVG
jgi:quercetin dioxygenase-like cupin family protein